MKEKHQEQQLRTDNEILNAKVNLDFFPKNETGLRRTPIHELKGYYEYFYGNPTSYLSGRQMIDELLSHPYVSNLYNKNKKSGGKVWK